MRYAGEGELKLKQNGLRTNTEGSHCIYGAGYVYTGFVLSAMGLVWTDVHQPLSTGTQFDRT